jgi:hypothetical protein
VRRTGAALALVVAVAVAVPGARASVPELRPIPLEALRGRLDGRANTAFTGRGLELEVNGNAWVALPFTAQGLELDLEASGPVLLTWAARSGSQLRFRGPPWRYAPVPRTRETLRLDLRIADGWSPSAQPVLLLTGGGTVVVHAIRARPVSSDPDEARAAHDRALLWAPESVGHTTINLLTPSFWSASRGIWLADVVAGVGLVAFVVVLAAVRLVRRRLRPGLALAAATVVAVGAWDVHFLARFLPMAKLSLTPDREARIRDNFYFDPELGAVVALARATLRPDERVGAMGAPNDWFHPQTLCFNLAPRRCAILKRGEQEHAGISGVGRLRSDEVDAIVSVGGGPLPEGFVPVAAVSSHAWVARRR